MKALLIASLFISAQTHAQSVDFASVIKLANAKESTIAKVHLGMTKKVVTDTTIELEGSTCAFTQTVVQSVLRIDGERMIILSKESFSPAATTVCQEAGYTPFSESTLFYEAVPTLAAQVAELEALASEVRAISRAGETVTLTLKDSSVLKYDFSKSGFRNLILMSGAGYLISTSEASDVDPNSVDLRDVFFCDSSASEKENCARGDFSDILF